MVELFISYSSKRSREADRLERDLRSVGVRVIRDVTTAKPFHRVSEFMKSAVERADACAALLSEPYLNSMFCMYEAVAAFRKDKARLLPVRVGVLAERFSPASAEQARQFWRAEERRLQEAARESEAVGVEAELCRAICESLVDLYAHFRDVLSPSFEELQEQLYRPLLEKLGFEPRMLRAEVIGMAWMGGDVEDQENRLDDFLEKHPDHALAHHVRGLVLQRRGDSKRSLRSYERCVALAPDFPDGHNDLAYLLENFLGDRKRAREHYERAIELDERFDLALNNLGVFLEREGDFEGAKRLFERALEVNPGYTGARMNRATLLAERFGKIEEARRELEEVLKLDDSYADAHANYAILLEDFFHDPLTAREHHARARELRAASDTREQGWENRR